MARYYFHVHGVDEPDGVDLPTLADAKCEAVRYAGQLICDSASRFWDTGDLNMVVSDETGLVLFTLQFTAIEAPAIRASSP